MSLINRVWGIHKTKYWLRYLNFLYLLIGMHKPTGNGSDSCRPGKPSHGSLRFQGELHQDAVTKKQASGAEASATNEQTQCQV